MTLYDLTAEWLELIELAEDPETDPETLADTMEALGGEIEDKVDGYGKAIRQVEVNIAALKAEEARMSAKRKAMESNVSRMKEAVKASMIAVDRPKIKTALFSFAVANNPPTLIIDDESKIPDSFLIPQEPKVDTAGIKAAIKDGQEFDWCHTETGQSLRIR